MEELSLSVELFKQKKKLQIQHVDFATKLSLSLSSDANKM